jgi:hypothetical protein
MCVVVVVKPFSLYDTRALCDAFLSFEEVVKKIGWLRR